MLQIHTLPSLILQLPSRAAPCRWVRAEGPTLLGWGWTSEPQHWCCTGDKDIGPGDGMQTGGVQTGDSHSFCVCAKCFPTFLCLFQKRVVIPSCCSLCSPTQRIIFQGPAEPDWLCLGHHYSKSSPVNVTFPGIMLQCHSASFSTQILGSVGREEQRTERVSLFALKMLWQIGVWELYG